MKSKSTKQRSIQFFIDIIVCETLYAYLKFPVSYAYNLFQFRNKGHLPFDLLYVLGLVICTLHTRSDQLSRAVILFPNWPYQ